MPEHLHYLATSPFEAACQIDILPIGHRSRRLHGHSFLARVRAALTPGWAPFPGGECQALGAALAAAVAPLDYRYLNDQLPVPTDENLARWLRGNLNLPDLVSVGVQSTHNAGAELDGADHCHLWHRFRFEAAHRLPKVPAGHPCGRLHGHGFDVILHADQELAGQDMGLDFDDLASLWAPFQAELHYSCLNDIPGLENPTSELLAYWLWNRLKPLLPALSWVSVYETATAGCHFDGVHYRIWKELRFEAALRLVRAPAGDRRRRLYGHSYLLRLHLTAPLDQVMGWTVDYGDVKALFKPVYNRLDHHRLDEITGLADSDPASLTQWIRGAIASALPQLERIDLYDTPSSGVSLSWGEQGPALPA